VPRERIADLQKRLLFARKDQHEKFVDEYLISITDPFDRLRDRFAELFDVDILEKTGSGTLRGTPDQFRGVVAELLVLAKIWGVNLERSVWGKYPNKCPYCMAKPCACGPQKSSPHKHLRIRLPKDGLTLLGAQQMLAEIYPGHRSLLEEILHVVEEIDEIETEAITFGKDRDLRDEFADVFARMAGLATHLGIDFKNLGT
jgi:hypothetical protein